MRTSQHHQQQHHVRCPAAAPAHQARLRPRPCRPCSKRAQQLRVTASLPLGAAGLSISSWSSDALSSIKAGAASLIPSKQQQQVHQLQQQQQLLQQLAAGCDEPALAAPAAAALQPGAGQWALQALLRRLPAAAASSAAAATQQQQQQQQQQLGGFSSDLDSSYSTSDWDASSSDPGSDVSYAVVNGLQAPSSTSGSSSSSGGGGGSSDSSSSSLRFAKHLAVVTNGSAPPASRFESLGWLLFDSKRRQQAALAPHMPPAAAAAAGAAPSATALAAQRWLQASGSSGEAAAAGQLLERIYLIGQGLADLGTADSLSRDGSSGRAVLCLDYCRLLERYLTQHGALLAEGFVAALPDDELQAKAIHVATALETRCIVHALLFDRLLDTASSSGSTAPLIINTLVNSAAASSSPSVTASPSAVSNSSHNTVTNSAGDRGLLGWLSGLRCDAVLVLVWAVAGRLVAVVFAVFGAAKDLALQLLMLRAMSSAAKGLQAAAGAAAVPAVAVAVAGEPWPAAPAAAAAGPAALGRSQHSTAPRRRSSGDSQRQQQPWRVVSITPTAAMAAGSLGLLTAHPLAAHQQLTNSPQQQQQQQRTKSGAGASRRRGVRSADEALLFRLWAPEESQLAVA